MDGDRNYALYVLNVPGGEITYLQTPPIHTAEPPIRWSADSRSLIMFAGSEQGELVRVNPASGEQSVLEDFVESDRDFEVNAWGKLASIFGPDPDVIDITDVGSAHLQRQIRCSGEVKDLAWGAGATLFCTIRRPKDPFFILERLDSSTGAQRVIATDRGDISRPRVLRSGDILYEVDEDGLNKVVLMAPATGLKRTLSPPQTSASPLSLEESGLRVSWLCSPLDRAPYLVDADARIPEKVAVTPIGKPFVPERRFRPFDIAPEDSDGIKVHGYWWQSGPRAVVYVHGGPHYQERPVWDAKRQYLLDNGISCAVVNYRGSTGYGQAYEQVEDIAKEADDVAATVRYLESEKGIGADNIVLMGESSGTRIAVEAAKLVQVGGLVLISSVSLGGPWANQIPAPKHILAFQGANDPITGPDDARNELATTFGSGFQDQDLHVMENEGHQFRAAGTWASVLSRIVENVGSK